ncbi:acyltransferase domain-containing protein [Cyclospora cayetanensis]|uniref:Acyltransferase domain-containing protein n=1 Tax=Cyclospora cayetanensis TaxID=88456 RepID=A0A1D3CZA5_9EIME|nr:acyltransferase domain-containing protein [Cyclospora cayetanensis]
MDKLSEGLYVTPTALVCTILALHRDGIREEDLISQVAWLRDELLARGGLLSPCICGFSYEPSACVRTVLGRYLDGIAESKCGGWRVASRYGGEAFDAQGAPLKGQLPRLLVAFYRNQCMHVFANEAFVAVAVTACSGAAAWTEGATMDEIVASTRFLLKLMSDHFVYAGKVKEDAIDSVVLLMEKRGILARHSGNGGSQPPRFSLNRQQEALVLLICSFLWPFVDSMWALGNALFTLQVHSSGGVALACAARQLKKHQLVARAHWLADGLCKQRILPFYESSSFPTISRGVEGFVALGVLHRTGSASEEACASDALLELSPEYREEAQLQALVNRIHKFRRAFCFDASQPDALPAKYADRYVSPTQQPSPSDLTVHFF